MPPVSVDLPRRHRGPPRSAPPRCRRMPPILDRGQRGDVRLSETRNRAPLVRITSAPAMPRASDESMNTTTPQVIQASQVMCGQRPGRSHRVGLRTSRSARRTGGCVRTHRRVRAEPVEVQSAGHGEPMRAGERKIACRHRGAVVRVKAFDGAEARVHERTDQVVSAGRPGVRERRQAPGSIDYRDHFSGRGTDSGHVAGASLGEKAIEGRPPDG